MKRKACQISLIIATAAAAPAALAGSDIVKCIDAAGHVTLTDQPCESGSATVRVATEPAMTVEPDADAAQGQPQARAIERYTLPHALPHALPYRGKWYPASASHRTPFERDVATLRAARLQMMIRKEARAQHPRLAGLD